MSKDLQKAQYIIDKLSLSIDEYYAMEEKFKQLKILITEALKYERDSLPKSTYDILDSTTMTMKQWREFEAWQKGIDYEKPF